MKKLDKYQRMIVGILIVVVSLGLIYVFIVSGSTSGTSSDDSEFPFFIIFSSWPAIWIPIIARKRQEAKLKQKELENYVEE